MQFLFKMDVKFSYSMNEMIPVHAIVPIKKTNICSRAGFESVALVLTLY